MSRDGPPVIVLGVRRSGTTLLRVMLDRNPALAIPDESYFVPQLARRHPTPVDPAASSGVFPRRGWRSASGRA